VLELGSLAGSFGSPALSKVSTLRRWVVRPGRSKIFRLAAPPTPFRLELHVRPTFFPARFGQPDQRQLGAMVVVHVARPA
jgi:hypothetical protein